MFITASAIIATDHNSYSGPVASNGARTKALSRLYLRFTNTCSFLFNIFLLQTVDNQLTILSCGFELLSSRWTGIR